MPANQIANEMAQERILLLATAKAALEHLQWRTDGTERLLRTTLRDLDGYRKGFFSPFCDYNPALSERGSAREQGGGE